MSTVGRVPTPEETADRLAIHEVLCTHCRGVDRAQEHTLKACYWPEAEVAYGGFNGSAHEFCAMLPSAITRYANTFHCLGNVLIELREDQAVSESYVTARHYGGPDQPEMTFFGRYLDRWQKRDQLWKLSHRSVLMDWNQNCVDSAQWQGPPFAGLTLGQQDSSDPVYDLFELGAAP